MTVTDRPLAAPNRIRFDKPILALLLAGVTTLLGCGATPLGATDEPSPSTTSAPATSTASPLAAAASTTFAGYPLTDLGDIPVRSVEHVPGKSGGRHHAPPPGLARPHFKSVASADKHALTSNAGASWDYGGTPSRATPFDLALDGNQVVGLYNVSGDAVSTDSASSQGGAIIVSTPIQLIFWGNWWSGQQQQQQNIINMTQQMLTSGYLEQMGQYGFQSMTIRGVTNVTNSEPPANFSFDDVGNFVWDLIDNGSYPEPDDDGGRNLYMVFMPQTVPISGNARGAHGNSDDYDFPADVDHAWVGWVGPGNLDYVGSVFSHELVESISDPESGVQEGWVMNRNINGDNEIGDACNNTVDRVAGNGLLLEAYWSNTYKACAMPLGSFRGLGVAGATPAVARTATHLDTFFVATDGSVQSSWWDASTNRWAAPFVIAPAGSALPGGVGVTAVTRGPNKADIFWVAPDGSVRSAWWDDHVNNGAWNAPFNIAPAGSALPGAVASVSRTPDHLDVFWVAPDGSVRSAWWDQHANNGLWNAPFTVAGANSALAGAIDATARTTNHLDVFWVGPDGSVRSAWWDGAVNSGKWNAPFNIAPAASALPGAVASAARTSSHLDVFWIAPDGSVRTNWWDAAANSGNWNAPFNIAPANSAVAGGVATAARLANHLDVFWTGPDGTVRTNYWDSNVNNGNWNTPFNIAPANSAQPGGIATVTRVGNHIDVFYTAPDGSYRSVWWDSGANNGNWNGQFNIANAGAALAQTREVPPVAGSLSASREAYHVDVFYASGAGAVVSNFWDMFANNGAWNTPFNIAGVESTPARAPVNGDTRQPNHIDAFWADDSGAIVSNFWDAFANGAKWNTPFAIAPAGSAPVGAPVASISRNANHIDVFWVAANGAVMTNFWDAFANGAKWNTPFPVAPAGSAQPGTPVAVGARHANHVDVFWTAPNGTVMSNFWDAFFNSAKWNTPFAISPAGSAQVGAGLAAATRNNDRVDVFWIAPNGTVMSNFWDAFANGAKWNTPFPVSNVGAARAKSPVATTARHVNHLDVFWIASDGTVMTNFWDAFANSGKWNTQFAISPASSAVDGAQLSAVSRNANHVDVFWTGVGGALMTNFWDAFFNGARWNTPFGAAYGPTVVVTPSSTSLSGGGTESLSVSTVVGSCGPVQLSVSGAPTGTSASLAQSSMSTTGSTWLYLGVAASTPPESGVVNVTASCGGQTSTSTVQLTTTACVPQTCSSGMCGSTANGCGGTISCGGCAAGLVCQSNECVSPAPTCHTPMQCCTQNGGRWVNGRCIFI